MIFFTISSNFPSDLDLDLLDLVKYSTGTLSFEWVINVKGGGGFRMLLIV